MDPPLRPRPLLQNGDIVFLIHGTFAAEADWIDPGSSFAKSLTAIAEVGIVSFRWSGINSHAARLRAGSELTKSVLNWASLYPTAAFHFVGHSHGGNVALYALRDRTVNDSVKTLTFLGTPFISTVLFDLVPRIKFLSQIVSWALGFTILFLSLFFGLDSYAVAQVLMFVNVIYFVFARAFVCNKIVEFLAPKLTAAQQIAIQWLWQPAPTQPVYIATVPADEARLWLTIVDSISFVPWAVWGAIYRFLFGMINWLHILLHINDRSVNSFR